MRIWATHSLQQVNAGFRKGRGLVSLNQFVGELDIAGWVEFDLGHCYRCLLQHVVFRIALVILQEVAGNDMAGRVLGSAVAFFIKRLLYNHWERLPP